MGTGYASFKVEGDRVPDKFPVGMKILLVDDDLTCLAVVKRMLLNCEYDVTTCAEATRALSLLRENKNAFDLIISDVHMPDMDGFRLLELVGLEMDLPVIMMSCDTRFEIVMKGVSHGACDFLSKPVRMEELQNLWQHVVRRKWLENREIERSGSMEESDHNRYIIDDSEYTSTVNDGTDSSWKYQKKKRDAKEDDDDAELDSVDPSSSKKPRVVWSVELHQQFVNAVNQLGIDKAVPKRILELMNVPGLTRENVASHLQKFRLYLRRLSGVAQQQNAFSNTLCGASSNAKLGQLGGLDLQTMAVSSQISPEILATLQDELLGRPSRSLAFPSMKQPVVQQALVQGNNCVSFERGISFGQPLLKGQELSSFPVWSSNNLGDVSSSNDLGGLNASQNSSMLMTMLPEPHSRTIPSESNHAINVQPSCLVAPTKSPRSFQVQANPMLNHDSVVVLSQSSGSYQAANAVVPVIQDSVVVSPQSSTSMKMEKNNVTKLRSPIISSQSYTSVSLGNSPGILHYGSVAIPSQQVYQSLAGNNFHLNRSSLAVPLQLSNTLKTQKDVPLSHNSNLNKDSSHFNYNRPPTQSNVLASNMAQMLDGGFPNLATASYSVQKMGTSDILSATGNISNTSWQLTSSKSIIGRPNDSPFLVHDSCNVQATDTMPVILSDKGHGKNLSKGTCLPSHFAVDDTDSPTYELTNGITYTGDNAYFLNQDVYGALQSGP